MGTPSFSVKRGARAQRWRNGLASSRNRPAFLPCGRDTAAQEARAPFGRRRPWTRRPTPCELSMNRGGKTPLRLPANFLDHPEDLLRDREDLLDHREDLLRLQEAFLGHPETF